MWFRFRFRFRFFSFLVTSKPFKNYEETSTQKCASKKHSKEMQQCESPGGTDVCMIRTPGEDSFATQQVGARAC